MKPVIIGAGLAGITTALSLAPTPVILISPRKLGDGSSSAWAQGGIAAAISEDDSAEIHAQDTLKVGGGLNDEDIVRQTTQDGLSVIENLISHGVSFDRDTDNALRLGLEAAHSNRRIVHATDATGRVIMDALIAAVRQASSVEIFENVTVQDFIVDTNALTGVALGRGDESFILPTNHVVLATGGAAGLWRDTTNPHENWGGGLALAARAGATLCDLEFVQFHPTAIDIGRDPMPLASEAMRGEGAILVNENSEQFIDELQPRDIVTMAIWQQITEGHRVFLDATKSIGEKFAKRFPTINAICVSAGINPSKQPIPIRPAAHYHMGGVATDAKGRTDVTGLWACGEVASTGLHGANRLASNSLLEAASFGKRVAEDILNAPPPLSGGWGGVKVSLPPVPCLFSNRALATFKYLPRADNGHALSDKIRSVMSDNVGVIRSRSSLQQAIRFLSPLAKQSDMGLVGLMIAHSAMRREESRGAHRRSDFEQTHATPERSRFRLDDLEK